MSAEPRELERLATRWLGLADEHLRLALHAFTLESAVP